MTMKKFDKVLAQVLLLTGLSITTAFSTTLLVSNEKNWTLPNLTSAIINSNRASTQTIVQILSNILSFFQIAALSTVINYGARIRLNRKPMSMNALKLWNGLCSSKPDWSLPLNFSLFLIIFTGLTAIPSALWAGALSPVSTSVFHNITIDIPLYSNVSLVQDYSTTIGKTGPMATIGGQIFSYSVGILNLGALVQSGSTATTVDGSVRQHQKLDSTRFTYNGRSYGIGSPVGLSDQIILSNPLSLSYSYLESGYDVSVSCITNTSTLYTLKPEILEFLYNASGSLPNSLAGQQEGSTYGGRTPDNIVAVGVAKTPGNDQRILSIAAGENYATLNQTQCSAEFISRLFNVSVDVPGRNITVKPLQLLGEIEPSGNLSQEAMRQISFISTDETNLFQSILGNALMTSISDFNESRASTIGALNQSFSTLTGVSNSVTAMLDDILELYGSAQLVVGNHSTLTNAMVEFQALRLGQSIYIYLAWTLNVIIVLLVLEEACRTRNWRGLVDFDFVDMGKLIVSSSAGGRKIAMLSQAIQKKGIVREKGLDGFFSWLNTRENAEIGKIMLVLDQDQLKLAGAAQMTTKT